MHPSTPVGAYFMHALPCATSRGGLAYWATHYQDAPFFRHDLLFSEFAPALYLGIFGYITCPEISFEHLLPNLRARYADIRGNSSLSWDGAIPIVWIAWERASRRQQTVLH